MKLLGFSELAGWPSSADTWLYMQEMMQQIECIGSLGGDNYIIRGCEVNGNQVAPGVVFINNEVLLFEGGLRQQYVIPIQEDETKAWFGGVQRPYYLRRKAVFGSGPNQVEWASLKRNNPTNSILSRIEKLEKIAKPLISYTANNETVYGSWLFWGRPANEIPDGWEPVPDEDWKGRVPLVLDENDVRFDEVGKTGGEAEHILSSNEQGQISFDAKVDDIGGGTSSAVASVRVNGLEIPRNGGSNQSSFGNQIFVSPSVAQQAHNNLQPYKVIMFIRFVG